MLPDALHDVWCRPSPGSPWALQLMVADTDGADWLYRRDHRVRRPVTELDGPASTASRPVIAPEVQLLYKSRPASEGHRRPARRHRLARRDEARLAAPGAGHGRPGNGWLEVLDRGYPSQGRTVSSGHCCCHRAALAS